MLEDSHTIASSTVEQVASELTAELASVAIPENVPASAIGVQDRAELDTIIQRLDGLDNLTARHNHAIKRMIELMARLVAETEANESR
jgi:hypothetical protein